MYFWLYLIDIWIIVTFSSVRFSGSVMSKSLQPHESQDARSPCPSPAPGVYSNSCPLSLWCHPAISSFVIPFSCPQSLPASGSFPMSQLFTWGGQSIGELYNRVRLLLTLQCWELDIADAGNNYFLSCYCNFL